MKANDQFGLGGFGGSFGSAPPQMLPAGYYLGLFTSEYKQADKLLAWAKVKAELRQDIAFFLASIPQAFDLRYAVGVQLDMLGVRLGVSRQVNFQPSNGVSPVLTDGVYRTVLQARVARNAWNGRIDGLQPIWQVVLAGISIAIHDNQDMTATILVDGDISSIMQDLIVNEYIIPRPETVRYNYVFANLPIFGADLNNAYIAGADLGHAI